jgi:hypothetical protein
MMLVYLLSGFYLLLLAALCRVLAVGQKRPLTLSEQKKLAWRDLPVRFTQKYPANYWALRITKRKREQEWKDRWIA